MGMKLAQTNFSSGELDPLMDMRHDTGAYINGARKLRNAALLNQGGVARRPGTRHFAALSGRTRLIPFEFSSTERYLFALSSGSLKVYDLDGTLLQTLSAPWTADYLFKLTFAQAADVMILCFPVMQPQIVRRTGLTTFTISNLVFDTSVNGQQIFQPYYKYSADDVTLSSSATTGTTTLTASTAIFSANHVGTRFRWFDVEIAITAVASGTSATGTVQGKLEGRYDFDPYKTAEGSNVVEVTHVLHGFSTGASLTLTGANATGGIASTSLNGTRTITVVDDNTYTFVAGANATSSVDGGGPNVKFSGTNLPTRNWAEPSFSPVAGWPGAVTFHEGRLWFGGSFSQPDGLWGSRIAAFFNFDVGDGEDNQSIQVTVGSDDISSVLHLVSNRHLQIYTATGEFFVPRNQQSAATPTNITISRQTPYGSSFVTPQPFDGATVYLQASEKVVREFLFTDAEQAYNSPALSLLAEHLIDTPHDMSVSYGTSKSGAQYLLLVNEDGTLAVFHSARAEKLAGWTLWSTTHPSGTAKFDSVTTIGERIYVSVQRGTDFNLERFALSDIDLTLDGASSFTASVATGTWTVGSLYVNRTVSVVSNSYYLGEYPVDEHGVLTLDDEVTEITVGFNYLVQIEPLPVHLQMPDGVYTGRPKRIARVILGLDTTLAVSIEGNRLIIRQVRDDFSVAPAPFTGKQEFFLLGFQRDATVTVTQTEPLPMRLLGMAMEVSF